MEILPVPQSAGLAVGTNLKFQLLAADGQARSGRLLTARGVVDTPVFMPVATQGALKTVPIWQVKGLGVKALLTNSYHLYLNPGDGLVHAMGGVHRWMGWNGLVITDSGGYQVFSLPRREITEEGVEFSVANGKPLLLTAEKVMAIQQQLGSDIAMAFDECLAYPSSYQKARQSMERTLRWAKRCVAVHNAEQQALFGIVQGGAYADLRRGCAEELAAFNLPGMAIGGLSVGEGLSVMAEVLGYTVEHLPADRPRYLMGVGLPEDLLAAIEAGIDMCDCVIPTKYARSGVLFTRVGRLRITRSEYRKDCFPIDSACSCKTCTQHTRAYLHHLFRCGDPLAQTLGTIHNLHFYLWLMEEARHAIIQKRFLAFKRQFLFNYQRESKKHSRVS